MPSWFGHLFGPRRTPERPASLADLQRGMHEQHDAVTRFFAGKPEWLLAHVAHESTAYRYRTTDVR